MLIKHPLIEENKSASGQQEGFNLCLEDNEKRDNHEKMEIVELKRKFYS